MEVCNSFQFSIDSSEYLLIIMVNYRLASIIIRNNLFLVEVL